MYGGFLDKIPFGAAFQKGLTFRMGQTHMMQYMKPLLDRIERGRDRSVIRDHASILARRCGEGVQTFRDHKDECIKVVLKPHGETVH